jgi:hypothetical protein
VLTLNFHNVEKGPKGSTQGKVDFPEKSEECAEWDLEGARMAERLNSKYLGTSGWVGLFLGILPNPWKI